MRVHIDAPAFADPLDIAKAVVGPHTLLKAEATGPARSPFSRWKALSELYKRVEDMYRAQAKRMVEALVRYIESIHGKKLVKAEGGPSPVPLLTPEQLEAVAQIIRDHHTGFAIRIGADTSETQDEIQRLLDDGLLPPEAMDIIEDSYHYGQVVGSLRQFDETKRAKDFSYDEFKKRIERRPVSVDAHDRAAMDWAKHSVAIHCRGLGNRIADDLSTTIIDADAELRRKYVTEIRDATGANIERHQTWRRLASDLGHKTEDWTRDMMRIAATEKQNAFQEGFSQSLIEREGDPDTVYVAKIPSPSACKDCVRLHLTQGQGSPPRVFLLSELYNNGTNIGRKRAEWLPTVGTVHPFCFVPGTMIETSLGQKRIEDIVEGDLVRTHRNRFRRVKRLSKRFWTGDLVVVSAGDHVLESTPEHPYLTARGWLPASSLEIGEGLFESDQSVVADVDAEQFPPQDLEQGFFSAVWTNLSRARMPMPRVNLDRDSDQTQIDVAWSNGHLGDQIYSFVSKFFQHSSFVFGEPRISLSGFGGSDLLNHRPRFASNSFVGSFCDFFAAFGRTSSVHDLALLAHGSDGDPLLYESRGDRSPRCPHHRGNGFDALASPIQADDLRDVELEPLGHETPYHGVGVTSIERRPYQGFVYNFSVEEDESYVANGLVVHNCACELVHVPPGWKFAKKPPEGEGWTKVPGKSGAWRRKDGDDWKHWSPDLEPELELERSEASFARDLRKAIMRYRNVPDDELSIRVGDPVLCQEIEKVVARTPRELFTSRTGVTLITTDIARVGSELAMGDLAYWTGNEIRISQTLEPEKLAFVLEHEFGHAPNVFLLHRLGSEPEVRRWHDNLYEVSRGEGYVSHYAKVHPIENSAEVTRLYLYNRGYLMGRYPRQFEYVHRDYRDLFGDRVQVA